MHSSIYEGIVFIEGTPENCQVLGKTQAKLNGFNAQQKSLTDVKKQLAWQAKRLGGNAIINFSYGQKAGFWASLLSWDDVHWHGSGQIAKLSPETYQEFNQKSK